MICVAEARRLYGGADAVHDFDHVLRVWKLAARIGRTEGADLRVVRAAALLHDVDRHEAEAAGLDHAAVAAGRARDILSDHPALLVEAVAHAIAAHRFRTAPEPDTLEAQVIYDADKLDAIGAVGVARAFAYGGAHGQRLWAPIESVDLQQWKEEGDNAAAHTPVHEFVVKLSRIKDHLYTAAGRRIAAERHDYMSTFFQRMAEEVRGTA